MKTIGIRKLRSNSRWWQFTEPEQAEIRGIFEHDGEMAAIEYCRQIGKPWSHTSISRFFAKERAARRAEDVEIRKHLARLKELIAIYAEAGMDITEAMAIDLAAKLLHALTLSEADPKTAEGRAIIMKVATHVIRLRALELREREATDRREFKTKEVELAERRVAVQEKKLAVQESKLAQAMRQNAEKVQEIMPGSGNNDEKTEVLGRAILGEDWDDDLKDEETSDSPRSPQVRDGLANLGAPARDSTSEFSEISVLGLQDTTNAYQPARFCPALSRLCSLLQPSATLSSLQRLGRKNRRQESEDRG